jgi:hypothetical protein
MPSVYAMLETVEFAVFYRGKAKWLTLKHGYRIVLGRLDDKLHDG